LHRPRDAGEVAAATAAYQLGVQERLRRVERERTAAKVEAVEQRKRRRVQLTLMLAVFAVFTVGFYGVFWQKRRAEGYANQAQANAHVAQGNAERANRESEAAKQNLAKAQQVLDRLTRLGIEMRNQPGMFKTGHDVLQEVLTYYRAILKERS